MLVLAHEQEGNKTVSEVIWPVDRLAKELAATRQEVQQLSAAQVCSAKMPGLLPLGCNRPLPACASRCQLLTVPFHMPSTMLAYCLVLYNPAGTLIITWASFRGLELEC